MRVWVAICRDDTTGVASSPAIYGGTMTGDSPSAYSLLFAVQQIARLTARGQ
jgi:hypothetical protein